MNIIVRVTDDSLITTFWMQPPDDVAYLESEPQRQEYVLNETGRVYIGSAKSIQARPWVFGQVRQSCLVCCRSSVRQLTMLLR